MDNHGVILHHNVKMIASHVVLYQKIYVIHHNTHQMILVHFIVAQLDNIGVNPTEHVLLLVKHAATIKLKNYVLTITIHNVTT